MKVLAGVAFSAVVLLCGCHQPAAPKVDIAARESVSSAYPARAGATAPAFKVFHHTADSVTLVTKETASNEEIESLIWTLRDAAHARTLDILDKSGVFEKVVDARKPIVWVHVYRGAKCAAEKYASGTPPCGGSYHAAADFTYGDYSNHEWDNGILLHDGQETPLWDTSKPYAASGGKR